MSILGATKRSWALLSLRDRRLLLVSMLLQMGTSLLDLVGVVLIGLVGALSVTTIQSQPPPAPVTSLADALGLQDASPQELVVFLSITAAGALLLKSILSSYLTRRILMFLANRQALVSARLAGSLLARPLTFIQQRSSQETAFALIGGAGAATSTILGQLSIIVTELAVLALLAAALILVSPWIALGAIAFFAVVAYALQRAMGGWASRVGVALARTDVSSLNVVQEALAAYREISVSSRRSLYIERFQDLRWQAAKVAADNQFIGMFPKYMFEAALVIGGFVLAGVLFATQDSVVAVGTLALFLAAGTRVMPSLLRLQTATLYMRSAAGTAAVTFELADELGDVTVEPQDHVVASLIRERINAGHKGFEPRIEARSVSLRYPGASSNALRGISLSIGLGESVALVGPSGSGKSSLADILLGLVEPDSGDVLLSGLPPHESISRWPGAVAYVPQLVVVANDTVRANVALGLPSDAIDDDLVWSALARAQLRQRIEAEPDLLDTIVGESGLKLSGGQRQRLGIARALYTRPKLLILDEATSSLDAETEHEIVQTLAHLDSDVTKIVIAHRLSTVRDLETLFYLEDGQVIFRGTFDQAIRQIPSFARQAGLSGLHDAGL